MAFVKGRVLFSKNNSPDANNPLNIGIKKVPIVLRDVESGRGIGVYSTENGEFSFIDVPDGNYHIIETRYYKPEFDEVTSFKLSIVIEEPIPGDPYINSVIIGENFEGNRLISLNSNVKIITIKSDNVEDIVFLDAAVLEIPFDKSNIFETDNNYIYSFERGTFGELLPGSEPETSPVEPPYNEDSIGINGDYIYEKYNYGAPGLGRYSISNTIRNNNFENWWNISDHTTGDERGRMEILQVGDVEKNFFVGNVPGYIESIDTDYFFISFWVCNIVKDSINETPKILVELKPIDNLKESKFLTFINDSPQVSVPTWRQFGAVIKSTADAYRISFKNLETTESGNAFIIDDLSYRYLISYPRVYLEKKCDNHNPSPGDILTYTITLLNKGPQKLQDVILEDRIPDNTTLVKNSMIINDIPSSIDFENYINLHLYSVKADDLYKVSYKVKVDPNINNIPTITSKKAYLSYRFFNPVNELDNSYINSKEVVAKINYTSSLIMKKNVDKIYIRPNDILTYEIIIINQGEDIARNIKFFDIIPKYTSYVEASLYINEQNSISDIELINSNIPDLAPSDELRIRFKVRIDNDITIEEIVNTCFAEYEIDITVASGTDPIISEIIEIKKITESEVVVTEIKYADLKVTKSADKFITKLGDIITYTINIENIGNVKAEAVALLDIIDNNTRLVPNSININNNRALGIQDLRRFILDDILAESTSVITFSVQVTGAPVSLLISNFCDIKYEYTIDSMNNDFSGEIIVRSNIVEIEFVPDSKAGFVKAVNKEYADREEELTYFLSFSNITGKIIKSLTISDAIPENTQIVENSLIVNGEGRQFNSNNIKVDFQDVVNNRNVEISYRVTVAKPINAFTVRNVANAIYNLSTVPSQSTTLISKEVETKIRYADIVVEAKVDKSRSYVNDILSYEFTFTNKGNQEAYDVIFKNVIQRELSLIQNTIKINNQLVIENPTLNNLNLPLIRANEKVSVTYKARINIMPSNRKIINSGEASYYYIVNPNIAKGEKFNKSNSNLVVTDVFDGPRATITKSVDKRVAKPLEELKYYLVVENIQPEIINNLTFSDEIPQNTIFINDSIVLDGVRQLNSSPINIVKGILQSGQTSTLTYKVRINANISNSQEIVNQGKINYTFTDNSASVQNVELTSNEVQTLLEILPQTTFKKIVNKDRIYQADELTYTMVFKNNSQKILTDIKFIDTIPQYTKFIANSATLNGNEDVLGEASIDKNVIIIKTNLLVGETVTASYKVKVDYLPGVNINEVRNIAEISFNYLNASDILTNYRYLSNEVVTAIDQLPLATLVKAVNKRFADNKDTLNYNIKFINTVPITIPKAVIIDTIPNNTTLIVDSIKIDGVAVENQGNPILNNKIEFTLDNVGLNKEINIDYQVEIKPIEDENYVISNEAYVGYYIEKAPEVNVGVNSNIVDTTIQFANVSVKKYVDRGQCIIGDELNYKITVTNEGNVEVRNVIINDRLVSELSLVPSSVYVDEILSQDIQVDSVNINTIATKQTKIIKFKAVVNTLPSNGKITNFAIADYSYSVGNIDKEGESDSNIVTTVISKGPTLEFIKSVDKDLASIGESLTYTLEAININIEGLKDFAIVDNIPANTTFVRDSMFFNGVKIIDTNPPAISLALLNIGEKAVLKYSVTINKNINNIKEITNQGQCVYKYLDNSNTEKTNELKSNQVITILDLPPAVSITKAVDKVIAYKGDILTYTVVLKNNHTSAIQNVVIYDSIPSFTTVVSKSIVFNGNIHEDVGDTITTPIINSLNIGEKITLIFKVKINEDINLSKITNIAKADFSYRNKKGVLLPIKITSNMVETTIKAVPIATFYKNRDKEFAELNEEITYNLHFVNSTGRDIFSLTISDDIPENTVLVANSLKLNEEIVQSTTAGSINLNFKNVKDTDIIEIFYKVKIDKTTNKVVNIAKCSYKFSEVQENLIDIQTEEVVTFVKYSILELTKSAQESVYLYDRINYFVSIANNGNVSANNIIFIDTIPKEVKLDANSIKLDGVKIQPREVKPILIIDIPIIANQARKGLEFSGEVIKMPAGGEVVNTAIAEYRYTVNPQNPNGRSYIQKSNIVRTIVNDIPKATLEKRVDKLFAGKDDILTYNIRFINNTERILEKVTLVDTIPEETSILPNSLSINNVIKQFDGRVISEEFALVNPNSLIELSYKVEVAKNKSSGTVIRNSAYVEYNLQVYPKEVVSKNSNVVETRLKFANIIITKSVNKNIAYEEEVLEYTLEISNIGSVDARKVFIKDIIVGDVTLIPETTSVQGTILQNVTLESIPVGVIAAGEKVIAMFNVRINKNSRFSEVNNKAEVYYKYTVLDSAPDSYSDKAISNTVITQIRTAMIVEIIPFNKAVDKQYADIDDILNYQLNIINDKNEIITNTKVIDTIPNGLSIIRDSLVVNGVEKEHLGNVIKVNLDNIEQNGNATISFKARIDDITQSSFINDAYIAYRMIRNPNKGISYNSGRVTTYLRYSKLSIEKEVSKSVAYVGDELMYTITLTNLGNIQAEKVVVEELLEAEVNLVENSIKIDGIIITDSDLSNLIISNIRPTQSVRITYNCIIRSVSTTKEISNIAKVKYSYKVNPSIDIYKDREALSNIVITKVDFKPTVTFEKRVDKKYADNGDELTYELIVRNAGRKLLINNSILDEIPNNAIFIPGSIKLNGKAINSSLNKINLPNLDENEGVTVSYKVNVARDVVINEISNTAVLDFGYVDILEQNISIRKTSNVVKTIINNGIIDVVKEVEEEVVPLYGVQKYKITVRNIGNRLVRNLKLYDLLSENLEIIRNSVKIDDVIARQQNLNRIVIANELQPNASIVVTFQTKVISVPTTKIISNKSLVEFEYVVDPEKNIKKKSSKDSNEVRFLVEVPPEMHITKRVNKSFADKGEELEYTITITNNSDKTIFDNNIIDNIPDNTIFVENSLIVDNEVVQGNLINPGKVIGNLSPGQYKTVSYKVKVKSTDNRFNLISNFAKLDYYFQDEVLGKVKERKISEVVITQIRNAKLVANKLVSLAEAYVGDILTYRIVITNIGNTPANEVFLNERVPDNTELVLGTILINGVSTINNLLDNISLGTLQVDEEKVVTFDVKIINKPLSAIIENTADVVYRYTVNPLKINGVSNNIVSTVAITKVKEKDTPIFVKTVNSENAINGDVLTYRISVRNGTNRALTQVSIIDTIPENTRYVPNSLQVSGIASAIIGNVIKLNFDLLEVNNIKIIEYKVIVNVQSKDIKNVWNKAYMSYRLGSPQGDINEEETIRINTNIIYPDIQVDKMVDLEVAKINDRLKYSISIINNGNMDIFDVVLTDILSAYLNIVENSLKIDNIIQTPPYNFQSIKINNINAGGSIVIEFEVIISRNPPNSIITNIAEVKYRYNVSQTRVENGISRSREVKTVIQDFPQIDLIKSVDKSIVNRNEELTYTLVFRNNGPQDVTNIEIIDTIPSNTVNVIDNLQTVMTFRKLLLKRSEEYQVKYKVKSASDVIENNEIINQAYGYYDFTTVDGNLKNGDVKSNLVNSKIIFAELTIKKSVNKKSAILGNILEYVIRITNTGNKKAVKIIATDNLSNYLRLISDSVYIDGENIQGTPDLNIFEIGELLPSKSKTIIFKAQVIAIPKERIIENICIASYSYYVGEGEGSDEGLIEEKSYSNPVIVTIKENTTIEFIKYVDKEVSFIGDTLNYKLTIVNIGDMKSINNIVIDTIPSNTTFIEDSIFIDGVKYIGSWEEQGIRLKDLEPNNGSKVEYQVKVNNIIGTKETISNIAELNYSSLKLDGSKEDFIIESNEVKTLIIADATKLIVTKCVNLELAEKNEILTYKLIITNPTNYELSNVILKENLSENLEFINSSLVVNYLGFTGLPNLSKFSLDNIKPGETVIIVFRAQIISIPTSKLISNYAEIEYSLKDITGVEVVKSNTVTTRVLEGNECDYGKFTLKCKLEAKGKCLVPLKTVAIRGGSIINSSGCILLSKHYTFKVQWNIIFLSKEEFYDVSAMLILNNKVIKGRSLVMVGNNLDCKVISLSGTATFTTEDYENCLKLMYNSCGSSICIVGASLKIVREASDCN